MKRPRTSSPTLDSTSEGLFRACADNTRRQILQLLTNQELSVSELVAVAGLPQSTVSRHLKVLREAGLAHDRREGPTVLYSGVLSTSESVGLRDMVVRWLGEQPLPRAMSARLDRVLRTRDNSTIGFFDRLGQRWDDLRAAAFGDAFPFEAMVSLLPREWRVADVGAGTGYLLPSLAEHFREVVAVDPSEEMLACARRRVSAGGLKNVAFHRGDLGRLPLADASCDLAVACLVIHHVADPADAIREIARIVRPGGRILVVEQQAHEIQSFFETMQDRWWGFDPAELTKMTSAAGFDEIRTHALHRTEARGRSMDAPQLFTLTGTRTRQIG